MKKMPEIENLHLKGTALGLKHARFITIIIIIVFMPVHRFYDIGTVL